VVVTAKRRRRVGQRRAAPYPRGFAGAGVRRGHASLCPTYDAEYRSPEEFKRSLAKLAPPDCAPALQALWWAAKDDWNAAHKIVMKHDDADCAWVHAHLHRVEGDLPNAGYWYRQAGKPAATTALDAERDAIIAALL
jgi:hypothetical protein